MARSYNMKPGAESLCALRLKVLWFGTIRISLGQSQAVDVLLIKWWSLAPMGRKSCCSIFWFRDLIPPLQTGCRYVQWLHGSNVQRWTSHRMFFFFFVSYFSNISASKIIGLVKLILLIIHLSAVLSLKCILITKGWVSSGIHQYQFVFWYRNVLLWTS